MRFSRFALMVCLLVPGLTLAQDEDYELAMQDVETEVGEEFTFEITVDNEDGLDLQGWQFGVCHDNEVLELEDGGIDTTSQDDFGLDWTFYSLSYQTDDDDVIEGWTVGGLLNVIIGYVVEPGANVFYEPSYTVLDDATPGSTTDIEFCETLGSPAVTVRMIADSTEFEPVQINSEVTIAGAGFIRGDVDGDGETEEMADALALLDWGFLDGDDPPCMSAADINDDGVLEPIEDVIFLVLWAFMDGPEPPAPGPTECGGDETDDDLGCETAPDDCA